MPNDSAIDATPPPRFAVVTITYNNLARLKATAETIMAQTSRDFDWAIVDGGSTDESIEYIKSLDVPDLRWVSGPDGGIYGGMNKGIDLTRGTYLIFMNAGDCFADPGELEAAVKDVESDPDLLYGDTFETDGGEERYFKAARGYRYYWYSMFSHHQSIYYHRRLFEHQRYDESFKLAGDWAFTAKVVRASQRIKYVRRPISLFLRGGGSFTAAIEQRNAEMVRVHREAIGLPWPLPWLLPKLKAGVNAVRFRFPWLYDFVHLRRVE